jgi:hypothetical protein
MTKNYLKEFAEVIDRGITDPNNKSQIDEFFAALSANEAAGIVKRAYDAEIKKFGKGPAKIRNKGVKL